MYIFLLSKNTETENPKLTKEEKLIHKFLRSHANENDFEEKRKKRPTDQS
jgi:hypothetical protein